MSNKNLDGYGRWRSKTVAFRISPEENEQLNKLVHVSGLAKQDYITNRLLCKTIEVKGGARVYKALRNQFSEVLSELKRLESCDDLDPELLELIRFMSEVMAGMKEGSAYD